MDLKDINAYFKQGKISFRLKKNKTTGYIFLLGKDKKKDSAVCVVFLDNDKIETEIYYSAKDTLNSLARQTMRPYIGMDLEN